MERKANAEWKGNLKDGHGTLSTASGIHRDTAYDAVSRFESGPKTNPEELIAAAHASCFSMARSHILGESGLTPESVRTNATLNLEKLDAGWTITAILFEANGK